MAGYAAAAGVVLGGLGTIFSSQDARRTRNQLRDLANTPGLDIDTEIANALAGYEKNLSGAGKLAAGVNASNSANMRDMLAAGIPGYENLQQKIISNIDDEASGKISQDVMDLLDRTGAARGVARGTGGGSQFDRYNTLRDFGITSMALKRQGQDDYLKLIAGTPLPGLLSAGSFLGPSISDRIGVRQNERTQRLGLLGQSIGVPGTDAIIGNWLQETGGALAGAGAANLGGGAAKPKATGTTAMSAGFDSMYG